MCNYCVVMMRGRPPNATRTDTLFPYSTLVRSSRLRQSICAISRRVRFESMSATPTELVPRPPRGRVFEGARRVRLGDVSPAGRLRLDAARSEEHTSDLQSLMRISYAVFCLKNKKLA